jgi:beta-1,4-mannosyl-glycoprotein beta-1,4-N-acetylglucosaminyltransferase
MRIIDAFLFFNELELLEIRLNEMSEYVDKFILVESTKNFQLQDKPLYFLENKTRFQKFLDKIIHYIYEPPEDSVGYMVMDNNQRKSLKNPLDQIIKEKDLILISDVDEIIKKECLRNIKNNILLTPTVFVQQLSYNFINTIVEEPLDHKYWKGSIAIPFNDYINSDRNIQNWRNKKDFLPQIYDAGWHFSFVGGKKRIQTKIESWGHIEYNKEQYKNLDNIEFRMRSLQDPLGRENFKLKLENDKTKFPSYAVNFPHLFYNK